MATLREQFATNVLTVTKFRELMRRMRATRPNDDLGLIRKAYGKIDAEFAINEGGFAFDAPSGQRVF